MGGMKRKKQDAARAAFLDGPPPYVQAADLLAGAAASQYVRFHGLKFRSEVAADDFQMRARRAALEAAALWQPRDRRTGFAAFRKHVFKAVDAELHKPLQAQGRATGGTKYTVLPQGQAEHEDTRTNRDGAFDVAAAIAPTPDPPADAATLAAFKAAHPREHDLAIAVRPYTENTPERYARQSRKAPKYSEAERGQFQREVQGAASLLRLFAELRAVPTGLEFEGVSPVLAHDLQFVLSCLVPFVLPGRPPGPRELLGPFGKPGEPIPVAEVVRDKAGAPAARFMKDKLEVSEYGREYLAKLLIWALPLSEHFATQQLRTARTREAQDDAATRLAAIRAERERYEATEAGQAAGAVDARRAASKAAHKFMKKKAATRKR